MISVIAGFFTGGALAVRGGWKAARNSAISCGILLAVIEGAGIGLNRMMAGNNRPQNPPVGHYISRLMFGSHRSWVFSCRRKAQRSERYLHKPTFLHIHLVSNSREWDWYIGFYFQKKTWNIATSHSSGPTTPTLISTLLLYELLSAFAWTMEGRKLGRTLRRG